MNAAIPYPVPQEPGRWRAIFLAAIVHGLLFAFLWIGVRWQSETPVAIEAEVWDMPIREAAPKEEPVAPAPPPKEVVIEKPVEAPDIALEQEKKRKADLLKAKELKKLEQEKLEQEKRKQELEEKKKLELQDKAKAAAEKKARDRQHDEELKRMLGTGGNGAAAKSTAPKNDDYLAAIQNKIQSKIAFAGNTDVPDNPRTIFKIAQLPSGEIFSVKKVKSSGVAAFDAAVENAIAKSSPLPKRKNGTVERELEVVFYLKDAH